MPRTLCALNRARYKGLLASVADDGLFVANAHQKAIGQLASCSALSSDKDCGSTTITLIRVSRKACNATIGTSSNCTYVLTCVLGAVAIQIMV
jgi:hypothetical protein